MEDIERLSLISKSLKEDIRVLSYEVTTLCERVKRLEEAYQATKTPNKTREAPRRGETTY